MFFLNIYFQEWNLHPLTSIPVEFDTLNKYVSFFTLKSNDAIVLLLNKYNLEDIQAQNSEKQKSKPWQNFPK